MSRRTTLVGRALRLRCPNCGGRGVLRHWLQTRSTCPHCGISLVLGNPVGPTLVVGLAAGVTIWTLILLLLAYQPMRRMVFAFQALVVRDRSRLLAFVIVLFAVPTAMLLFGR